MPASRLSLSLSRAIAACSTQLGVEILTWQPFEQVTIRLPDDKPFQVRSAWSATLVAMDDEVGA